MYFKKFFLYYFPSVTYWRLSFSFNCSKLAKTTIKLTEYLKNESTFPKRLKLYGPQKGRYIQG